MDFEVSNAALIWKFLTEFNDTQESFIGSSSSYSYQVSFYVTNNAVGKSSSLFGNDEDNWCVLYSIYHYEETYYWHFLSYWLIYAINNIFSTYVWVEIL